ncbi:MAG: hypothetical protein IPK10_04040 [Bacteroidetes bacterium]|nr:hypothetical protein [Bacteroidota bacterium]
MSTVNGIFFSSNNGFLWSPINSGLTNMYVNQVSNFASSIFACTRGGLFIYNGSTWSMLHPSLSGYDVMAVSQNGGLYVGTFGSGVFVNGSMGWVPSNEGLAASLISSMPIDGSTLFAGTVGAGFSSTHVNGSVWAILTGNLPTLTSIRCILKTEMRFL